MQEINNLLNCSYKYYVTIQSLDNNKYICSNNREYHWLNKQEIVIGNNKCFFFLQFIDGENKFIISNDHLSELEFSFKKNKGSDDTQDNNNNSDLISIRLIDSKCSGIIGNIIQKGSNWIIHILNNITTKPQLNNNAKTLSFKQVLIKSYQSKKIMNTVGTTSFTQTFSSDSWNFSNNPKKIIKMDTAVLENKEYQHDPNYIFTLIPVDNDRFALRDSFGNHLTWFGNTKSAFTIQHLYDWEKFELLPAVNPNMFHIFGKFGFLYELPKNEDQGLLSFSKNPEIPNPTLFEFIIIN